MTGKESVDEKIASLPDWRGEKLRTIRAIICDCDPAITEDTKWAKATNPLGVPTWSCDGIVCTGEVYKDKIKLTFMHGALLSDPARLFNASLDAGTRRAIDIGRDDKIDVDALSALLGVAIAHNRAKR